MRRADRLFQIVSILRLRRLTTAAQLAARLEVSERTIYRDVADLVASGVPIEGEAGVGYRLRPTIDLPPLMFTLEEIHALVLGARMVEAWGDDDLRRAARSMLDKVEVVLPEEERKVVHDSALFSLSYRMSDEVRARLLVVRHATHHRRCLALEYQDESGSTSARVVRPLGLFFWGPTWTLAAWCEMRQDYRNFRLDRVVRLEALERTFELASPVTLGEFVAHMRSR